MVADKSTLSIAIVDALAQWGTLEVQIAGLFRSLSDIRPAILRRVPKAYTIFDAIISFDGRLAVIDALMAEEEITPLEAETWNRFSKRLRKLYKRRHGLAHFVLSETGDDVQDRGKWNHEIIPFFSLSALLDGKVNERALGVNQIKEREQHFGEAAAAISYFIEQAEARRGRPLDSPMPEPPLVARIRETASQILEERARKPQPLAEESEE